MTERSTIAVATVRGVPDVQVMRTADGQGAPTWTSPYPIAGWTAHPDDQVTNVVPQAVVAVQDADLEALAAAELTDLRDRLVAALTVAGKPAEPTDRGSTVVDRNGRTWTRVYASNITRAWVQPETRALFVPYTDVDAVRVRTKPTPV